MVKALFEDFQCSLIKDNKITTPSPVMTGVKKNDDPAE